MTRYNFDQLVTISRKICPWGRGKSDLSKYNFTCDQKLWIVSQNVVVNTAVSVLAAKFNMDNKLIYKWIAKYKRGESFKSSDEKGRPPSLTPEKEKEVYDLVYTSVYKLTYQQVVKEINARIPKFSGKDNKADRNTIAAIIKKLKLKEGMAEPTTVKVTCKI
jgi:transposase